MTGGQQDQEHGVVLHVHGEGYQPLITSRIWISQVTKGLIMTGGQGGQGHGVVLHVQGEGYQF